jgi:predicted N-formylglutamate amidohydrolase
MFSMEAYVRQSASSIPPVLTINADGASPFVIACDHASNRIPAGYGDLGLSLVQRLMHIAWDPGALAVALQLADLLDAPLVQSTVSRLVVDCNREPRAIDLIPTISERTEIPGNREVSANERERRIAAFHAPFHDAIEAILDRRKEAGQETIFITVHSFTPVYKEVRRPWPIGLIHGRDTVMSAALRDALCADQPMLNVGWNEPYSAMNGVTLTLERHGDGRGLPATMIEIRHDEILEPGGIALWSARLARCLEAARKSLAHLGGQPARAPELPLTGV